MWTPAGLLSSMVDNEGLNQTSHPKDVVKHQGVEFSGIQVEWAWANYAHKIGRSFFQFFMLTQLKMWIIVTGWANYTPIIMVLHFYTNILKF